MCRYVNRKIQIYGFCNYIYIIIIIIYISIVFSEKRFREKINIFLHVRSTIDIRNIFSIITTFQTKNDKT